MDENGKTEAGDDVAALDTVDHDNQSSTLNGSEGTPSLHTSSATDILSLPSLRKSQARIARRHSTAPGLVYPIADPAQSLVRVKRSRRRSISSRVLKRNSSILARRSLRDVSSKTVEEESSTIPEKSVSNTPELPSESPYDEMMVRFQIRQLQRTPSTISNDHRATVASSRGLFGSTRGAVVDTNEGTGLTARHQLHQRLSSRNVSDYANSTNDVGSRTASFRGDSIFTEAHRRFESVASSAQLDEQFNLAFGDLDDPADSRIHSWHHRVMPKVLLWQRKLFCPISPYSRITRVRYLAVLVATVTYVVWFPLELAFPIQHQISNIDTVVSIMLGVDVAISLHTAYVTKEGALVASHGQIAWNYVKTRFVLDVLLAVPLLIRVENDSKTGQWPQVVLDGLSVERLAYVAQFARMVWLVRVNQRGRTNIWAWLLYSRYSHLLRIAGTVVILIAIAHYIGCIWTLLLTEGNKVVVPNMPWHDRYYASFYAALLLLQGEGVPTDTAAQNLFASLSALLGSIVLAVVFGHVAMLVSDFNANFTNYQRKMEAVIAMTAKLQLPTSLRERVHQYYEHLWHEYECLDGEIVQFSKQLSHTLALEVVLFKYMELVMHIPFWTDSTPDFQKQLMLGLDVRVYLPDDFIVRQGEVDDEFYMVNRGYCELSREGHRFERVTTTMMRSEHTGNNGGVGARRRTATHVAQMDSGHWQSVYELDAAQRRYYSRVARKGSKYHESLVTRGQAFGDLALLMSYQRAANVRAITHVEMCVLSRESFQAVIARYPDDRHHVVVEMLTSYMQSYELAQLRCPMLELVRDIYSPENIAEACAKAGGVPPLLPPTFTARQAAERIYTAINVEMEDTSLKFGVGVHVREQLIALRERRRQKNNNQRQSEKATSTDPTDASTTPQNKNIQSGYRSDSDYRFQNERSGGVHAASEAICNVPQPPSVKIPPDHQTPSQIPQQLTWQARLKQVEEREVAILRMAQELHCNLKILQSRRSCQTTARGPSRKRSVAGADTTIQTESLMALSSGSNSEINLSLGEKNMWLLEPFVAPGNIETRDRSASPKQEIERHPRHLMKASTPITMGLESSKPRTGPSTPGYSRRGIFERRRSQSLRSLDPSFHGRTAAASAAPSESQRRKLFQRTVSHKVLQQAPAPRASIGSLPASAIPNEPLRRNFFRRTHSQKSFYRASDTVTTAPAPRASIGSNADIFHRMAAFVTDTSSTSQKQSPTRYADALFNQRSKQGKDDLQESDTTLA